MLFSIRALLLLLFLWWVKSTVLLINANDQISLYVVAEVELPGKKTEAGTIEVLANADTSLNIETDSEVEASAAINQQAPARGRAGNGGSRGGVGSL